MTDENHVIKVGIADLKVVRAPDVIRTSGLGSCVGVVIYDEVKEVAGLAHVMLPDSSLAKLGTLNLAKFADTAITELIKQVVKIGGFRGSLKAKIAGGAQMFQFLSGTELMRIGPRNVEAVIDQLKKFDIEVLAAETGGNNGRTIEFNPATRNLTIRTIKQGVKIV